MPQLALFRTALPAAAAMFVAAAGTALLTAQSAPTGKTVWDGVYTDAQASRAQTTFGASCAECHTLSGLGDGPLSGEPFWEGYSQRTVSDLLTFVRTNMPNGNGNSLSASAYADLVALILRANGIPSGPTELTPETAAAARIVPKGGGADLPANTLVRIVGCLAPKSGSDWVLTKATSPERVDKTGVGPDDAARPLGEGTATLKFVLNRLDGFVGQKMSVSGMLIGPNGVNGINVSTVNRVAEACQ